MRSLLVIVLYALPLLTAGPLAACAVQGGGCADVIGSNAWVTDVAYDDQDETLYVALSHALSYCTGTDEKPYVHELITVDLATGAANFEGKASNDLRGYDLPESGSGLYRGGHFGNGGVGGCYACELVLHSDDAAAYTFRFTTRVDSPSFPQLAMILDITRGAEPVVTIDIGGSGSEVHVPEGAAPAR